MSGKNGVTGVTGLPCDAYVEVGIDQIDHGQFKDHINGAISDAAKGLLLWHKAMKCEYGGEATVSVSIKIKSIEKGFMKIQGSVHHKVPSVVNSTSVIVEGGVMLCDLDGTSNGNPLQMMLFDRRGNPRGTLDAATGELIEPGDDHDRSVAGSIAPSA